MTTEPQRRYSHLTLIEVILGVLLLSVAAFFAIRGAREARHREEVRLITEAMDEYDRAAFLKLAKANPELWSMKDKNGVTPLHYVAHWNAKDVAELLLAKGAEVNVKDDKGGTPLHLAARENAKDVVELLIAKGADVNMQDNGGWTPLRYAAFHNAKEVVALLIAKGADINAKANNGETPLQLAIRYGNTEVADLLRAHGAKE